MIEAIIKRFIKERGNHMTYELVNMETCEHLEAVAGFAKFAEWLSQNPKWRIKGAIRSNEARDGWKVLLQEVK